MKLVLSAQYKHVDDNMTAKRKELEKTVPDIYDMTNLDVKTPSVAKKKLKEYVDLLEKSKTVSEYTFEDWYYKGLAAFDDENYLMTVNCMQRALEKDNDNENIPNAYLYIGLSYQYLEMYKEALEQYDKILTDYPAYPNKDLIFYNKGVALDDMKEPLKALEEYDKALSIDNEYADVWYNKAAIYARQGDKAKMLDALKNAIDNDDECKPYAKKDKDFKDFWNDNEFIKLTT
jgi:tetratricopeptide (TPR) repeat protein